MTDAQLLAKLQPLREYLGHCWAAWAAEKNKPENADGKNMCRFTAAFLANVLGKPWRAVGGGCRYNFQGNSLLSVGGFFDGTNWQAHYWVTDGKRIVDLTANQFGAEPIIITSAKDPRYDANYWPSEVREALTHVRARARQWAAELELQEAAEQALLAA